uniref:Uncharacterized protein n=1 Tax=Arundo donax TaxID=35708 RepID=A0A0A9HIR1_ARUDO
MIVLFYPRGVWHLIPFFVNAHRICM